MICVVVCANVECKYGSFGLPMGACAAGNCQQCSIPYCCIYILLHLQHLVAAAYLLHPAFYLLLLHVVIVPLSSQHMELDTMQFVTYESTYNCILINFPRTYQG